MTADQYATGLSAEMQSNEVADVKGNHYPIVIGGPLQLRRIVFAQPSRLGH
jgi:hypothetical protein